MKVSAAKTSFIAFTQHIAKLRVTAVLWRLVNELNFINKRCFTSFPDFSFNKYCKLLNCLRQYLALWFVYDQANCIKVLLKRCYKFEKA